MTDAKLKKIAVDFRKGLLGNKSSELMCAAVCMPLQAVLSLYGVETTYKEIDFGWINHVWLRLPDGRILDPTADQFNIEGSVRMPKVYLGEVPDIYQRWMDETAAKAKKRHVPRKGLVRLSRT